MAELRRKLVIVGDGACGKVILAIFPTIDPPNMLILSSDLSLNCLLKGHIPRGYLVLVHLESTSF